VPFIRTDATLCVGCGTVCKSGPLDAVPSLLGPHPDAEVKRLFVSTISSLRLTAYNFDASSQGGLVPGPDTKEGLPRIEVLAFPPVHALRG
jgi:hypothetical protein